MGRKRTPCDFCSGEFWPEYQDHRNGFCIWMEIYPHNHSIAVIAQANDEEGEMQEDCVQIQMDYCPVCGRKMEY